MSSTSDRLRPIVAVIGTTGVGKSQLAVSLAQSLRSTNPHESDLSLAGGSLRREVRRGPSSAVVLSADSMQLYKGLDVITNKVTEEERGGIEHWGLDMVTPGQGGSWEVGRWCTEADRKLESLPSDTLPIVCGGTHYFIQHYLFPPPEMSLQRKSSHDNPKAGQDSTRMSWTPPGPRPPIPGALSSESVRLLDTFWTAEPDWPDSIATSDTEQPRAGPSNTRSARLTITEDGQLLALHQLLAAIDPKEAGRWHWRDGRKVRRSLERWWERGGPVGEAPEAVEGGREGTAGRKARFRTLIFWVYEPLESLRPRLDKRVDKMVENGLLREIAELRETAISIYGSADATDHTEGIFQSIGYKEFATMKLPTDNPANDPSYAPALERTKLSTHQYAKSQLKWIRKQLLPAAKEAKALGGEVEVYVVNGGEAGIRPALEAFHAFLSRDKMPPPLEHGHQDARDLLTVLTDGAISKVPDTADRQQLNARRDCEICSEPGNPYSVILKDWDQHCKSKVHRRNANPARNKEEWIAAQRARGEEKRAQREQLKGDLAASRLASQCGAA
ncbi:hypothetical protein IAU60_003965 [Kwoniella sp. DSM 27419]